MLNEGKDASASSSHQNIDNPALTKLTKKLDLGAGFSLSDSPKKSDRTRPSLSQPLTIDTEESSDAELANTLVKLASNMGIDVSEPVDVSNVDLKPVFIDPADREDFTEAVERMAASLGIDMSTPLEAVGVTSMNKTGKETGRPAIKADTWVKAAEVDDAALAKSISRMAAGMGFDLSKPVEKDVPQSENTELANSISNMAAEMGFDLLEPVEIVSRKKSKSNTRPSTAPVSQSSGLNMESIMTQAVQRVAGDNQKEQTEREEKRKEVPELSPKGHKEKKSSNRDRSDDLVQQYLPTSSAILPLDSLDIGTCRLKSLSLIIIIHIYHS